MKNIIQEYLILHMACLATGVIPVAIPASCSSRQLTSILQDSQAQFIFVDTPGRLRKIRNAHILYQLTRIVYLQHKLGADTLQTADKKSTIGANLDIMVSWRDLMRMGHDVSSKRVGDQMRKLQCCDLASIVYSLQLGSVE